MLAGPVISCPEIMAGGTMVTIEAMKMRNILKAEHDGVVKAVSARVGDPVAAGDVGGV